jgi:hypothetical protein
LTGFSLVTTLGVLLAVHFGGVDSAQWTQVTSWKSPLVLAGALVFGASVVTTFVTSFMLSVVGQILAGRKENAARPKPARPQSNRRTSL